jgi:hypothetical protein
MTSFCSVNTKVEYAKDHTNKLAAHNMAKDALGLAMKSALGLATKSALGLATKSTPGLATKSAPGLATKSKSKQTLTPSQSVTTM